MLEILEFTFRNFWTWLGMLFMLAVVTSGFTGMLAALLTTFKRK